MSPPVLPTNCLVLFDLQTRMRFLNNSATEKGAAIFISALLHCQWHESLHGNHQSFYLALNWNDRVFEYKGNFLHYEGSTKNKTGDTEVDIATDTYQFVVKAKTEIQVCFPKFQCTFSESSSTGHRPSVFLIRNFTKISNEAARLFPRHTFYCAFLVLKKDLYS